MKRVPRLHLPVSLVTLAALAALPAVTARAQGYVPAIEKITVGDGVELHYVALGKGTPVIFVHGSLSDGSYWNDQLASFAESYQVIAYSRRYNLPNTNTPRPGYSAIVDAEDLAALIEKLHLGKVSVVGHSYGALTALFLAIKHPELVRSLVLAEAPAVSLLAHLPKDEAEIGKQTLADIERQMVEPMKVAFRKGDREAGLRAFIGFVLRDPQAWDKWSEVARQDTLKNVREWDVMMTSGELFPDLDPQAVRNIHAPVLLLSGEKSYPFLALIDEELERLIPNNRRIVFRGATHAMWFEQPVACRNAVLEFLRGK
ncbi:MAG TPA: alpha/beta hydrolase [Candidatus Acidoferrales bacterium]|jgi:pimeloyl-ACP methyl ester carboxylesterase|nr:alpha/beta hydrolase [Candidatus Acidoferrales bacterium]